MSTVRYFNPRMRRKILAGLSTPDWVNREELRVLHLKAKELTGRTGIEHVLDHIVPLTHPYVCGLTVPWNLQVITRAQNAAKSNRWNPDQLELFP